MAWCYRSTLTAKRLTKERGFQDRRSYVGLRLDGTEFLKLFGKDMEDQWNRLYLRDKGICQLCGDHCGLMGEADHIRTRGKGGDDSLSNLRLVCGAETKNKCHRRRHGREPRWMADEVKVGER